MLFIEIFANFSYNAQLLFTHKIVSFVPQNKYGACNAYSLLKYYIFREYSHKIFLKILKIANFFNSTVKNDVFRLIFPSVFFLESSKIV